MASSGFSISSSRSLPTRASQRLNGSALGLGIDWMRRKRPSMVQQRTDGRPAAVAPSSARGGAICPPPFETLGQGGVATAHIFEVAGGIGGVGKDGNRSEENTSEL